MIAKNYDLKQNCLCVIGGVLASLAGTALVIAFPYLILGLSGALMYVCLGH
jgi:hypothetical protein